MMGSVMVGDGHLYKADGWCSALAPMYRIGHHAGQNKLRRFVVCLLLDVYSCWHVKGLDVAGAFDKFVAERWPGNFLNEVSQPRLEESIVLDY